MTRFCGFDCEHARACDDVPGCMTFNPIQCQLLDKIVPKGSRCEAEGTARIVPMGGGDENQIEEARRLLYEYFEMRDFDAAMGDYKAELERLPGEFAPPDGCFLLAYVGDELVGSIAYKKLKEFEGNCEMKRLYVKPDHRGKKLGYKLIERLIAEAKKAGYTHMKLDNHPWMDQAERLYGAFGFKRIDPYWNNPTEGARYFELDMTD